MIVITVGAVITMFVMIACIYFKDRHYERKKCSDTMRHEIREEIENEKIDIINRKTKFEKELCRAKKNEYVQVRLKKK